MTLKRVVLLATSCKNGGLCPGGIDFDNPKQWIRLVADDGHAGPVQGIDIDFANTMDLIEFDGKPCPMLKQKENWTILNHSCRRLAIMYAMRLPELCRNYGYHGFWNNFAPFLTPEEMENLDVPSETIIEVSNLTVYHNDHGKIKADFNWSHSKYRIKNVSVTDRQFYSEETKSWDIEKAFLVISIPKECDWPSLTDPNRKAYKFISQVFPRND